MWACHTLTAPAGGIRWKKILEMGKPPPGWQALVAGVAKTTRSSVDRLSADGTAVDMGAPDEAAQRAGASERSEREPSARAALDISQIKFAQGGRPAKMLRRVRWARRHKSAEFLRPLATEQQSGWWKPVRPARCAWTIGKSVGIMHDGSRPAGYAGVERCSSIWSCPHCSAVIRAGRAAEIEQAVKAHQKTAGEVLFFTGTVRHHRGDELATTLDAVLIGWKKMLQSRGWARLKKIYGLSGYVRAIEVTHGQNSWHPHVHALLFLDEPVPAEAWDELRGLLFELWSDSVVKAGAKRPTEKGLDLRRLDGNGRILSAYLAKVQDEKKKGRTSTWGVGAEMSRSDVKRGRTGSVSPFEFLDDDLDGYSEDERARLWREYYSATKGRRAITWSRGLKKRYDVGEKTDEQIQDEAESTILVWRTHADCYREVLRVRPVDLARALELAEAEEWDELNGILPGRRAKAKKAPPPNRV